MRISIWVIALFCLCFMGVNVEGLPKESMPCQIYFSPHDQVADKLIALIDQEKVSVKAAVYCLMHAGIGKALKRAYTRGVDVEVIVDPYSVKMRSPIGKMVEVGIPVYIWTNQCVQPPRKKTLMHHKFCVFGRESVWTGSFNFTREGTLSNRENVVVLNNAQLAEVFLVEFNAMKSEGCCAYSAFIEERYLNQKSKAL